jgi:hypothetical protein
MSTGFEIFSKIYTRWLWVNQFQKIYICNRWEFRISDTIIQNLVIFEGKIERNKVFRIIIVKSKCLMILQCKTKVEASELDLKRNMNYFVNGRKVVKDDFFGVGDHFIRYSGKLLGGNPKGFNGTSDEDSDEEEWEDDEETDELEEEFEDEYEKDDKNIDVDNLKYADEGSWCYGKTLGRKQRYRDDEDLDDLENWIDVNYIELSWRIDR